MEHAALHLVFPSLITGEGPFLTGEETHRKRFIFPVSTPITPATHTPAVSLRSLREEVLTGANGDFNLMLPAMWVRRILIRIMLGELQR